MDDQWIRDYNFKNDWRWRLAYECDTCHKVVSVAAWAAHAAEHAAANAVARKEG